MADINWAHVFTALRVNEKTAQERTYSFLFRGEAESAHERMRTQGWEVSGIATVPYERTPVLPDQGTLRDALAWQGRRRRHKALTTKA